MPYRFVTALAQALQTVPETALVGVYLHGSAVLGGYSAHGSDVDVLAVTAAPADHAVQTAIADRLISTARRWPATPSSTASIDDQRAA